MSRVNKAGRRCSLSVNITAIVNPQQRHSSISDANERHAAIHLAVCFLLSHACKHTVWYATTFMLIWAYCAAVGLRLLSMWCIWCQNCWKPLSKHVIWPWGTQNEHGSNSFHQNIVVTSKVGYNSYLEIDEMEWVGRVGKLLSHVVVAVFDLLPLAQGRIYRGGMGWQLPP